MTNRLHFPVPNFAPKSASVVMSGFLIPMILMLSATGQTVGYHSRLVRLAGQTEIVVGEDSQSGGPLLQRSLQSAELGSPPATAPYDRFGQFVLATIGGVFLRTTAEEAGGGLDPATQDDRFVSGITGATEDVMTVNAGPSLAGQQGFVTIPLRIWFRATPPNSAGAPDGAFWSYGVNYAALTGDVDAATPSWENTASYSLGLLLFLGIEIPLPDGTDFNAAPVMLRVPVVFGTPQLFTIVGGVSAIAPLSQPRGAGTDGGTARLELLARFLPGPPSRVEDATGTEIPSGTWSVTFASGHDYSKLPGLPPPVLLLASPGAGTLHYDAPPGLDCLLEHSDATDSWAPLGSPVSGRGAEIQQPWNSPGARQHFFRLRHVPTT